MYRPLEEKVKEDPIHIYKAVNKKREVERWGESGVEPGRERVSFLYVHPT